MYIQQPLPLTNGKEENLERVEAAGAGGWKKRWGKGNER